MRILDVWVELPDPPPDLKTTRQLMAWEKRVRGPVVGAVDLDNGYRVAVRVVPKDGNPVVAEVRLYPSEPKAPAWGSWSGEPESVRGRGLSPTSIRDIRFGEIFTEVLRRIRSPEAFSDTRLGYDWMDWVDVLTSGGFDTTKMDKVEPARGRPPLADEELALVALRYDRAMVEGVNPIRFIIDQSGLDPVLDRGRTTQRVSKARKRGFLSPAPAKGVKGGEITADGLKVLQRMAGKDESHG